MSLGRISLLPIALLSITGCNRITIWRAERAATELCASQLQNRLTGTTPAKVQLSEFAYTKEYNDKELERIIAERIARNIISMEKRFSSLSEFDRIYLAYEKSCFEHKSRTLQECSQDDALALSRLKDYGMMGSYVVLTYSFDNVSHPLARPHFFCQLLGRRDETPAIVIESGPVSDVVRAERS